MGPERKRCTFYLLDTRQDEDLSILLYLTGVALRDALPFFS